MGATMFVELVARLRMHAAVRRDVSARPAPGILASRQPVRAGANAGCLGRGDGVVARLAAEAPRRRWTRDRTSGRRTDPGGLAARAQASVCPASPDAGRPRSRAPARRPFARVGRQPGRRQPRRSATRRATSGVCVGGTSSGCEVPRHAAEWRGDRPCGRTRTTTCAPCGRRSLRGRRWRRGRACRRARSATDGPAPTMRNRWITSSANRRRAHSARGAQPALAQGRQGSVRGWCRVRGAAPRGGSGAFEPSQDRPGRLAVRRRRRRRGSCRTGGWRIRCRSDGPTPRQRPPAPGMIALRKPGRGRAGGCERGVPWAMRCGGRVARCQGLRRRCTREPNA